LIQKLQLLLACLVLSAGVQADSKNTIENLKNIPKVSLLALDSNGSILSSIEPDLSRTPASTLKILTAWLAIKHWGADHQFHTDFFLDRNKNLWVKGYGDPFLVSEEIDIIAQALQKMGVKNIRGLGLDEQFFSKDIKVDGQSFSNNPYDAPLSALSANFNTLYLERTQSGIKSAEKQTPLTAIGRKLGESMQKKKSRFNIRDIELAGRYFGELLAAKLKSHGISTSGSIQSGKIPSDAKLLYRHYNSLKLTKVLKAMLQ
jgi:D-alanyl-D-alanine carboxypeptidase/D-alanyl-D-alanine-endopeptidase (penicillin-binding protein 4)